MAATNTPWRKRRAARGQALVEVAMVLPVLLLVMLLALDFGRIFFGWVGLQNAVRQGASFAAMNAGAWASPGDAAKRAEYQTQVGHDTAGLNCTPESPAPDPTFPDGASLGGRVEVSMTCDFTPITPLVGSLFAGGHVRLDASSTFPIRSGQIAGLPVGTALPSPDPSADPGSCYVPGFSGTRKNDAQTTWTLAGFLTQVQFEPGSGNYIIGSQDILGNTGDAYPCATTVITVGPTS